MGLEPIQIKNLLEPKSSVSTISPQLHSIKLHITLKQEN